MNEKIWKLLLNLPWEEKKKFIEIDTRGRILMMSVDIEFSLLAIMMYCAPDPFNKQRLFKGMTMGEKIQNTVKDLKDHKPQLYQKYKAELASLEEYRIVRNDMAHHTIEFHEPDNLRKFRARFVGEENKKETFFYRDYTVEYLVDFVNRFRAVNLVFAELVDTLKKEYNNGIA